MKCTQTVVTIISVFCVSFISQGAVAVTPARGGKSVSFPKGFLWGAATAAHQVEGNMQNDWIEWENKEGNVHNKDTSKVGVDHYNRFDSDFALAASMGHNVHRLSLEWSRIEPEAGQWNAKEIKHYHEVFASLKKHGLKPMVTLHHFTNPIWVANQGGWLSEKTVFDFERFAHFVGKEFGAEVDMWVTINEPNVYAFNAYESGQWPPQHKSRDEALAVMHNLAKAHTAAYHALHGSDVTDADGDGTKTMVGIAQHLAIFEPSSGWNPLDRIMSYFVDKAFNRSSLVAATTGEYKFTIPGANGVSTTDPHGKDCLDFIGVNYYTRWLWSGFSRVAKPDAPKNDLGWEVYPDGLYKALMLANEFSTLSNGRKIPVFITENGIDDRSASKRNEFLVSHLKAVAKAIDAGVDVRGYVHWTLMDNFEWAEGYASRFGLFQVDRSAEGNLARKPTPTVELYRTIATSNSIPENY